MNTYIQGTGKEVKNPDLTKGYIYPGRIWRGTQDVVMPGSVETFPPDGLRERKDVYEDCLFYVEVTPPEETKLEQSNNMPTTEERLTAVEAAILELAYLQGGEK